MDTAGGGTVTAHSNYGGFTIPTVALDKSTSGLSADGNTLVLAEPLAGLGAASSRFDVLKARSLRVRESVSLRGSYSFDAISPDGNLIYLIEYTNPANPSQYLVRAYDVQAGHLLRKPVIDPSEAGQPMTGKPVTRAMSPNGRWAYTPTRGPTRDRRRTHSTPQDPAPNASTSTAQPPNEPLGSRLVVSGDGDQLTIVRHGSDLGTIDTHTFAVSPPPRPSNGHGFPWVLIAILALVAAAGAGITSRVVRRRRGLASG